LADASEVADAVMPIIRHRVGTKVDEYPSRKLTLDNFRARQSRNTEKWRNPLVVA
jgi:hypothetical protein